MVTVTLKDLHLLFPLECPVLFSDFLRFFSKRILVFCTRGLTVVSSQLPVVELKGVYVFQIDCADEAVWVQHNDKAGSGR